MKKMLRWNLCAWLIFSLQVTYAQNVWTQHNDQARTGWYPSETSLTVNNVNQNTFGLNYSHTVDDRIVGQPLVILHVNIPGKGIKNVVYVTTVNNSVYAFDADENTQPYWQQNYSKKTAGGGPDCASCRAATKDEIHPDLCGGGYSDFPGNIGIVSTPVIDTTAGIMYFVNKVSDPSAAGYDNHTWNSAVSFEEYTYPSNGFHIYLHAVDIGTGLDLANSPVEVNPSSPGTGDGASAGIIRFNPRAQFSRSGLVLSNGKVYVSFAAHCDNNPSHGWVVSYNASTLAQVNVYNPTPNDGRGGIWMSGTAPAVDDNGSLYFTTGNSLNEDPSVNTTNHINIYQSAVASDPANRGESVIKLNPDLTLASYFTPHNYVSLNDGDLDLPTQVMLLPNTNLAVTASKDQGTFYVMDRTNLGGYNATSNLNLQTFQMGGGGAMHSSFAYFGGSTPYFYQFGEKTQLTAFPVTSTQLLDGSAIKNTTVLGPVGNSGSYMSVSSNGTDPTTGILWAYHARNPYDANNNPSPGVLRAFKASDIRTELWNSDQVAADNITLFTKMSCPTIALGKVFISANSNQFLCYGLKTNTTCVNNIALGKAVTASSTYIGGANALTDGDLGTGWVSLSSDNQWVYVNLGAFYDVCRITIKWQYDPLNAYQGTYGQNFDIQVSDDGSTWKTISAITGNTLTTTEVNIPVTTQYVRMLGHLRAESGKGYGINEFQVFGSPASPCRPASELSAVNLSPNSEQLTWDPVYQATQYLVKFRNGDTQEWLTRTVTTNSLTLNALSCASTYYYSVSATCGSNTSTESTGSFVTNDCTGDCDLFLVRHFHLDLGDVGVAGFTCYKNGIYTLSGSGTDIGGISDQFQFAFTKLNNLDYYASGHLIQQDQVYPQNKLGMMIRDSLTSTSRFAFVGSVDNGANWIFEYRDVPGQPATKFLFPATYPTPWFKIAKSGTSYLGYVSPDGVNWTQLGTMVDLHFGNDPNNFPVYGMAVTSANNIALSSGQIANFDFEPTSTPLPVKLISFTAKAVDEEKVLVSWATSMEHLSDYFQVQRSVDNKAFETIAKVPAVGESETEHSYSVYDEKPYPGINYYRLREFDKDGKFYTSPVVSVKFDVPNGFDISPNPVSDRATITSQKYPIVDIRLFDVTGKMLRNLQPGGNALSAQLNVSALPKGVYLISVKTTNGIFRQKLIKD